MTEYIGSGGKHFGLRNFVIQIGYNPPQGLPNIMTSHTSK